MKKIKYLLFMLILMIYTIPNVNALEYILPTKFAGKVPNDIFWLEPKATLFGEFYYETPVSSMDDYLLVTFCASGPIGAWTGAVNVQADGFKIDTDLWCSAGSYGGTIQQIYYPVNTWTYTEDNMFAYMQDTATFRNPNDYNVQVRLLNITSSSSLDMSMAILAYLKSKETNQDYSSALQDIKQNQEIYKEELNEVQDKIDETNNQLGELNDTLNNSDVNNSINDGVSFFDNFDTTDHGGLSGIITAPLIAINQMLNTSCNPMTATFKGKELSLPCGYEFWAKMGPIQDFINLVLGGLLCYRIIIKLYKLIEKLKNPEDDRVEVMNL